MKKIKILALTALLIGSLGLFIACGGDLDAPTGFSVDQDNKLSWNAVDGARNYVVEITDENGVKEEKSAKKTYYSLKDLVEGDYEIRVKAIAGNKDDDDSKWSETYYFHKAYETGCLYSLVNNIEYEITKVGSASGKVVIENEYRGKPVTSIADSAFKGSRTIESVVIGENVTYIGKNAFYNCPNLKEVSIPDAVSTIGAKAFQSCPSLKSITLPDAVTIIEESTFAYCRGLEKVNFGNSIQIIGDSAFSDCSALTEVAIPDSVQSIGPYAFSENSLLGKVVLGKSLTTINEYAFYNCDELTTITFSDNGSLNVIMDYAFSDCAKISTIAFPNTMTEIGYASFYQCTALEQISIPDSVTKVRAHAFNATKLYIDAVEAGDSFIYADKWLIACTIKNAVKVVEGEEGEEPKEVPLLKTIDKNTFKSDLVGIADETFHSAKYLEVITLSPSIKYLGKNAFYKNPNLYTIDLSQSSIETIGERAFYGCELLKSVKLKKVDGTSPIKRIDNYAFYGCKSLNNSTIASSFIPKSVTSIGTYAFKNTGLWETPDSYGVVYAGDWVVGYNKESLGAIQLKDGTRGISDYAFYDCKTLTAVVSLANAECIGRAAFYQCSALERVNLNRNLKTIEPYTFYKCTSLITVSLPSRLQTIGRSAFYKCESLNKLDFTETELQTIDLYAFYGSYNVEEIKFNEEIESIGDYAFYKCSNLQQLTIPDSLTTLGSRSFGKCEALKTLTIGSGLQEIGVRAFQNCISLESIVIPSNIQTVGNYAFYKCTGVRSITLAEGVKEIKDYAFYGLENLWNVSLPQSLTSIGKYAFKGCNTLQSIVLHDGITEVGAHAFYGCKELTVYAEDTVAPEGWHNRWNSSYRPVIWGCTLATDKSYVTAVTVTKDFVSSIKTGTVIVAPKRAGYTFVGWDTNSTAESVVYSAGNIIDVPVNTVLYAVWTVGEEEIPPIPTPPQEEGANTANS